MLGKNNINVVFVLRIIITEHGSICIFCICIFSIINQTTMSTESVVEPTTTKTKLTIVDKIEAILEDQNKELGQIKALYDSLRARQKTVQKMLTKVRQKMAKPVKPKSNRKPCGFARPTPVSKEMCDFLSLPEGSEVSRTTVTRALIQYIKDHQLQNPENKKQIKPDETLYKLFGEQSRKQELTYFTMQKFVNHHFAKKEGA